MLALLNTFLQWREDGKRAAFAVVVKTGGSAPRGVGARLLVCEDGRFAGSVSGGCVEAEVVAAALEVIKNGKTQMLNFAADDTGEWLSGLSCGGEMAVFVYPPLDNVIKTMREFIIARRIITITTNLQTGEQNIAESESEKETATIITNADGDGDRFIETLLPMRRLFIIGATHIAQNILPLARALEMECIIIDPRAAFATAERFGNVQVRRQWGDDAFGELPPDYRDGVIALTHDPKIDDPALLAAMKNKPGYIGALGSKRTHQKRLARLQTLGASTTSLAKIHAPVGLDIGAKTPAEIAIAIIGEMVGVFRGKNVGVK